MHFLQGRLTSRPSKVCILKCIEFYIEKQETHYRIISRNQFQVFITWSDKQNDWQLTFSKNLYNNSRLATLEEVSRYAQSSDGFVKAMLKKVLILSNGIFRIVSEDKEDFLEQYLYVVDVLNKETKELVTIIPVF